MTLRVLIGCETSGRVRIADAMADQFGSYAMTQEAAA